MINHPKKNSRAWRNSVNKLLQKYKNPPQKWQEVILHWTFHMKKHQPGADCWISDLDVFPKSKERQNTRKSRLL